MTPIISICATCYNHERFLPDFMDSVISQSMGDWELNIVDDCSTDGSFELLRRYASRDSRIHVVQNDRNRHLCYSGNRAASMAKADLITLISCDDLLENGKLEYDSRYLNREQSVAALYTEPCAFAEGGEADRKLPLPFDFSRGNLLRKELFEGNSLTIPGLTLRRAVWEQVGGYNPLLRMTQDHELHLKILERYPVAKSEFSTIRYRLHGNNLSRRDDVVLNAISNESVGFLSQHYLSGIASVDDLLAAIPECQRYGKPVEESIPYFAARYAIDKGVNASIRYAGYVALFQFLSRAGTAELLERRYNFIPKDFMKISEMAALESANELVKTRAALEGVSQSLSYRLGMFLTYPVRKVRNSFLGREP